MDDAPKACPRCGSDRLRMPSVGAGDAFVPGMEEFSGTWVCSECGLKAVPITFDSEEDRQRFEAGVGRRRDEPWGATETGTNPFPNLEAEPRSRVAPALMVLVGLFLTLTSVAVLVVAGGNPFKGGAAAVFPLLIGLPMMGVGWRLYRRAGSAIGT